MIDFNFSDLGDCGLHDAIVWEISPCDRFPLVNDFVSRFCHYFIYNDIINGSSDVDPDHLRLKVQSIEDELGLCAFVSDIASLNDCVESLPFAGFIIEVVHLEAKEIAIVNDDFSDGVDLGKSDDEVPFI